MIRGQSLVPDRAIDAEEGSPTHIAGAPGKCDRDAEGAPYVGEKMTRDGVGTHALCVTEDYSFLDQGGTTPLMRA